jgi:hypothetical protein
MTTLFVTTSQDEALKAAEAGWSVLPLWPVLTNGHCACPVGRRCEEAGLHAMTDDEFTDARDIQAAWTKAVGKLRAEGFSRDVEPDLGALIPAVEIDGEWFRADKGDEALFNLTADGWPAWAPEPTVEAVTETPASGATLDATEEARAVDDAPEWAPEDVREPQAESVSEHQAMAAPASPCVFDEMRRLAAMQCTPVLLDGKRPVLEGWTEFTAAQLSSDDIQDVRNLTFKRVTAELIETWRRERPHAGVGLRLGYVAGVPFAFVELDFDVPTREEANAIALRCGLPVTPYARFGSKGIKLLYLSDPLDPPRNKKYHPVVEVLADGQTVMPPSVHPDTGRTYEWVKTPWDGPATPLGAYPVAETPKLSQGHVDAMLTVLRAEGRIAPEKTRVDRERAVFDRELTDNDRLRFAGDMKVKLADKVASITAPGAVRSDAINGAAAALACYVNAGFISEDELRAVLHEAAVESRFIHDDGERAFDYQFESGLAWGSEHVSLRDLDAKRLAAMGPAPLGFADLAGMGLHQAGADAAWGEPQPVGTTLHPVAPFDAATMLPDGLRPWVADISYRMCCAPDFVAASALVALGSLIARKGVVIRPKALDDWEVTPNLWGAVVAPPAQKKSPAISAALKPLEQLQAKASEENASVRESYDTEMVVFETTRKAIEKEIAAAVKDGGAASELTKKLHEHMASKKAEPKPGKYMVNDATIEKLGEILQDNPAILMLRDELTGLMAPWEQAGREGDRGFYLEAWNGDSSYSVERIKRGSLFIRRLCVSLFGGIQPDKLQGYLDLASNALGNDGMLQRFQMLVYPDSPAYESRDRKPDVLARAAVDNIFAAVTNVPPAFLGCKADEYTKRDYTRFSSDAQPLFFEWEAQNYEKIETEEHQLMKQHLSKYAKLFPSLALIFHVVNSIPGGSKEGVSVQAARMAWLWCDYLETHARRCYGLVADEGLRSAQSLSGHIRRGALQNGFTAREVQRHGWAYLASSEAVKSALDWLEEAGWVRPVTEAPQSGGRPSKRYQINPKL